MLTNGKCQCNEGILQRAGKNDKTGEKLPEIRAPLVHDCDYIRQRDALIPAAMALADMRPPTWTWDRAFHSAMNQLRWQEVKG